MPLEVRVRKKLGSFLLDADFTAEQGVFALLGESGCGKSLTLKCIAGILEPDEGRIVLDGRVLYDSERKINLPPQKRRIGYMFQDCALFPNMTVRKNVMAGMGKKPDPGEADEYLRRFRIADLADYLPFQLSGGQKQRTAMARIAAQRPDAVLLDEPFSALDSHLKWQLEKEMKKTLDEIGKPAVFVSHSRDEVFHLCGTVCCMNRGHTEAARPLREFFSNPGTRTAALLSGCKNISRAEILDETHIMAEDFGIVLNTGREIPPETRYVGIRAHYLSEFPSSPSDTVFIPERAEVSEDLFEWTVYLKAAGGAVPVQWKTPKKEGGKLTVPEKLYLREDAVMLLSE